MKDVAFKTACADVRCHFFSGDETQYVYRSKDRENNDFGTKPTFLCRSTPWICHAKFSFSL